MMQSSAIWLRGIEKEGVSLLQLRYAVEDYIAIVVHQCHVFAAIGDHQIHVDYRFALRVLQTDSPGAVIVDAIRSIELSAPRRTAVDIYSISAADPAGSVGVGHASRSVDTLGAILVVKETVDGKPV